LETDRVTADAWSDHHWQSQICSQALGEVRHRLVDVLFLWQLLSDGLQGDFQLISRLRLPLEFMVLFHHSVSDQRSNLESLRATLSSE